MYFHDFVEADWMLNRVKMDKVVNNIVSKLTKKPVNFNSEVFGIDNNTE